MRMTLLEIVQSTLNSMDSDSVDNLSDTIESSQVATVAKEVYFELMSFRDWAHLYEWRELESVGDTTRPNYLRIPDTVARMDVLKYDITAVNSDNSVIAELIYKDPKNFIKIVHSRNSGAPNVETVTNSNGVTMFILNDKKPEYWTSFDDEYVVTDSYDSTGDTTLNSSKSSAWCRVVPAWTTSNSFVPDMPTEFFPAYLAEVKSVCHAYFKQQISEKDEQKARRGLAHVSRKERFNKGNTWHNYGR